MRCPGSLAWPPGTWRGPACCLQKGLAHATQGRSSSGLGAPWRRSCWCPDADQGLAQTQWVQSAWKHGPPRSSNMPCALWHGPYLQKQACALLTQWVVGAEEEKAEEGKRRLQQMSRGGIPLSYLPAILCFSDIISYLGSGERTSMPGPSRQACMQPWLAPQRPAGLPCSADCRLSGVHTSSTGLQGRALGWPSGSSAGVEPRTAPCSMAQARVAQTWIRAGAAQVICSGAGSQPTCAGGRHDDQVHAAVAV